MRARTLALLGVVIALVGGVAASLRRKRAPAPDDPVGNETPVGAVVVGFACSGENQLV